MKKLISFCIGITLLASPVLVSAQTTSTNNVGVIAALEQLVATLTQELQSLLTAQRQSTPSTKQNSPSNFTATPTSGAAALSVKFNAYLAGNAIDFGDGSSAWIGGGGSAYQGVCTASTTTSCIYSVSHVYSQPGTYAARLFKGQSTIATLTINVTDSVTA